MRDLSNVLMALSLAAWACGCEADAVGGGPKSDSGTDVASDAGRGPNNEPSGCVARVWEGSITDLREAKCRDEWVGDHFEYYCVCDAEACPLDLDLDNERASCAIAVDGSSCHDALEAHCGLSHDGDNGFCEGNFGLCWALEDGTHTCQCTGSDPIATSERDCYTAVDIICPDPKSDDAG